MVTTVTLTPDPKMSTAHPDLTKKPSNFGSIEDAIFYSGRIREKAEAVKKAQKELGLVKKFAIHAGLVIQDLEAVMGELVEDIEVVKERHARRAHYAQALGMKMGQLDLFADAKVAEEEDLAARAKAAGYRRGLAGEFADEQAYPINTPEGQAHAEGWAEGQKVLAARFMQLNEKIAETSRQAAIDKSAKEKAAEDRKRKREENAKAAAARKQAQADKAAARAAKKANGAKKKGSDAQARA